MEVELEAGDHPEVAAAATESPEEVRVLVLAGGQVLAVRRDQICGCEVVTGQAVLAAEMTDAATERQPRDSRLRDDPTGRRQPEGLGFVVHVRPRGAGLDPCRPRIGVYPHAPHLGEVDDEPVVADGGPGDVVPAATDRHQQVVVAGEGHRADDVTDATAPSNQGRTLVDHPVPHRTSVVVVSIIDTSQIAVEFCLEPFDLSSGDRLLCHTEVDDSAGVGLTYRTGFGLESTVSGGETNSGARTG